jgi:hypothetical protein
LSSDRNSHRLKRGHSQSAGHLTIELRCGATDINIGDAGSVRWIAFLGRACRRHRQLLSTHGNDGVIRYLF